MDSTLNPAIPSVEIGEEFHAGDKSCAAFTMMCRGTRIGVSGIVPVVRVFMRHMDMRIFDESQLITDILYWHTKKECPNHE